MKIYQKIFAKAYDPLMNGFEKKMACNRFDLLNSLRGTILDVGSGTGVNFKYYHSEATVLAIEPSLPMIEIARNKMISHPNIELYNHGINDTEMHNIIAEGSLDAITCTLVLCTIPDPELAINNFRKWLKPKGKLVILEHVKSENKLRGKLQEFINPLWNRVGEGCNLTRNTDALIESYGFVADNASYFNHALRWHQAVYRKGG